MNEIRGIVTAVNEHLLFFVIDRTTTVHAARYSLKYNKPLMPALRTLVHIRHYHIFEEDRTQIFLCPKGVISLCHEKVDPEKCTTVISLLRDHNLGVKDLWNIKKMFDSISVSFPQAPSKEELSLCIFQNLINFKWMKPIISDDSCLNKILHSVKIKNASDLRYVDAKSTNYPDFPYWSFGIHRSRKTDVLLGFMFLHPNFGAPFFRDADHRMVCILVNSNEKSVADCMNQYVLITKFVVITEIYQEENIGNLEFILIDMQDINVLSYNGQENKPVANLVYEVVPENFSYCYKTTFQLKSKSTVGINLKQTKQFWIEIIIIESDALQTNETVFLCINEKYLTSWYFLELENVYQLLYSKELNALSDVEFIRINQDQKQYGLHSQDNAIFVLKEKVLKNDLEMLSTENLSTILASDGLVNFKAKLKFKKFNDPNSSRTSESPKCPAFGTPGPKTVLLDFEIQNEPVKTLVLYLNNWESLLTPFALIPEVIVEVRNVIVQKNKYLKTTALTTIQVTEYSPKIPYQTANLYSKAVCTWGQEYFLGCEDDIPDGVLVCCTPTEIKLRSLSIKYLCSECSYVTKSKDENCLDCEGAMIFIYKMTLLVRDEKGRSIVILKNPDLIRKWLELPVDMWRFMQNHFKKIGRYTFDRRADYLSTIYNLHENYGKFLNSLTGVIISSENSLFVNVTLKCRKISSDRHDGKRLPLWFCVDAKNIIDRTPLIY